MIIYGLHSCMAAVKSRPDKILKVYVLDRKKSEILGLIHSLPKHLVQFTDEQWLQRI
ncbi:MAG: hypothetical protein LBL32_00570, partial [Holosporales bacterium]|nr:hypothetical protein [Holosporales bacterium]